MNKPDHTPETQPQWLQHALRDLPQELNPEHDLWPGIATQLKSAPQRRWVPLAIAASLLVSVLSVGSSFYLYQRQQTLQNDMALLTLQKLESPYQFARASYAQSWPQIKQNLDPETAQVVEKNLRVIAKARDELAKALNKNPDDQVVQNLLRQTLLQEIDTYAQIQKLAQKKSSLNDQTI